MYIGGVDTLTTKKIIDSTSRKVQVGLRKQCEDVRNTAAKHHTDEIAKEELVGLCLQKVAMKKMKKRKKEMKNMSS